MRRREFSAKTKAQAAERAGGHCEQCTRRLLTGDFNFDHINPDEMGGEPILTNCQVLCRSCHHVKTHKDRKTIAKSNHVYRAHIGVRKRGSFATNRDAPFKKKIDGTLVRR